MKFGKLSIKMVVIISVISLLLVGILAFCFLSLEGQQRKVKFAMELSILQDLIKDYQSKNDGKLPVKQSMKFSLSDMQEQEKIQFQNETITEQTITLYRIDENLILMDFLKYGTLKNQNDIYVISSETGMVYYLKGLKVGDTIYHTLTDDLKQLVNY